MISDPGDDTPSPTPSPSPSLEPDLRWPPERRRGDERRHLERRTVGAAALAELQASASDRRGLDRRTRVERRGRETAEEHVRNALQLLIQIAEAGSLGDEDRRDLDAAMFRLRFAVERLRRGAA